MAAEIASAIDDIEPLITRLVQQAPDLDDATLMDLRLALEQVGTPLARSIWRALELAADQLIDPGIALPALAEACATLVAGCRGTVDDKVLETARYQIDTLQPVPDRPRMQEPDVPLSSLRKR
ncbi:MAG: hypothetical protein JWO36_279 [Myxococcales bacterium]|nr:hypothetical protein [Myxococcales bacterium]